MMIEAKESTNVVRSTNRSVVGLTLVASAVVVAAAAAYTLGAEPATASQPAPGTGAAPALSGIGVSAAPALDSDTLPGGAASRSSAPAAVRGGPSQPLSISVPNATFLRMLETDEVRDLLRRAGYERISPVDREGLGFRAQGTRADRRLSLRVVQLPSLASIATEPDAERVKQALRSGGYDQVESIQQDGTWYRTQATRGGRAVSVTISLGRGVVIEEW